MVDKIRVRGIMVILKIDIDVNVLVVKSSWSSTDRTRNQNESLKIINFSFISLSLFNNMLRNGKKTKYSLNFRGFSEKPLERSWSNCPPIFTEDDENRKCTSETSSLITLHASLLWWRKTGLWNAKKWKTYWNLIISCKTWTSLFTFKIFSIAVQRIASTS